MRNVVLAFAFSTLLINPALADKFFPLEGGPGGSEFKASCGSGSVVVGLRVRWGAWIDSFSLRCASLNRRRNLYYLGERFPIDRAFGFSGGGAHVEEKFCPSGQAVTLFRANTVEFERSRVLNFIEIQCRSVKSDSVRSGQIQFAETDYGRPDPLPGFTQVCAGNNFVSGIVARAWTYVDAVGIVCMSKATLIQRRAPTF